MMTSLMSSAKTPAIFLFASGLIMVYALATSKKAKNVIKTSVDLARQEEGDEMFGSSALARTIVRRAERRLWTLNRKDPVSPGIMQFVNRLSDLFFTMARYEMFRQGNAEERWQSFLYKRKK